MAFLVDVRQQRQGHGVHCTELEEGMPVFAPATAAEAADHMNKGAASRSRTFTQADEMQVMTSNDGAVQRCVEFDGMLLTVTGGGEVAEVVVAMDGAGAELRVLPSESYLDAQQQVVHVVDVQGEREALVLLVVVARQEEDARIVTILKFT